MPRRDELRQIAKVAGLYYQRGVRQADIAAQMSLSQSTVSRLLKRAYEEGIVRVHINLPAIPRLAAALIDQYGLRDAVVIPAGEASDEIRHAEPTSSRYACLRCGVSASASDSVHP